MAHHWADTLAIGKAGEDRLAAWLSERYKVQRVEDEIDQAAGIDYRVSDGVFNWTIEVKSCAKAHITGNAFIETLAERAPGKPDKPGWLLACKADWLIYQILETGVLYVWRTTRLRERQAMWESYPRKVIRNLRYTGAGHCVPLDVFGAEADAVIKISDPPI